MEGHLYKKKHILIVDDDAACLMILEETLGADYRVEIVNNGEDALRIIKELRPDVVLLDIMMPDIDGLEVCRRIRSDNSTKYIKIILISGLSRIDERLTGYQAGADDYIAKPFDIDELRAKIKVFVKLKAAEEVDDIKSGFLSMVNGETGAPLDAIIALSSLLLREATLNDDDYDIVNNILIAAQILSDKVDRIQLLSAIKIGKNVEFYPVCINEVIGGVVDKIGPLCSGKKISIILDIVDDPLIVGDANLISKVLFYLVENAIQYSPAGSVIKINSRYSSDNAELIIDVVDQGSGFGDVDVNSVFHVFNPGHNRDNNYGFGMSLALSRAIIEMHNGKIEVSSSNADGSTISTRLCLANEPDPANY